MTGTLEKMQIEAYKVADYSGAPAETFVVMFNPNTYAQKYDVDYEPRQGAGDSASPQVFGKIKPQEYTFEFLFDGTGAVAPKQDVPATIDRFLTVTGKLDGEIHRPMYLRILWGALVSKCVLKSAEITYTLFEPSGRPLRAKVKATFAENVEDALRVKKENKSSPDLTHVRVVQEGDHLTLMCARIYGDPSYYVQVAEINGLDNYRQLEAGQTIRFPPLRQASS